MFEAKNSGKGQVVDTAMVDGVASMMACSYSTLAMGYYNEERGTNILDSGAPFYDSYECADGEYMAVGAIEPQFYAALLAGLELDPSTLPAQMDMPQWPALKALFTTTFKQKKRDEWAAIFEHRDACVTPILKMSEVINHPHIQARHTLVSIDGKVQPAPSPRFSRTPGAISGPAAEIGANTDEILASLGLDAASLRASGAVS
jgi:alpha-methylacyl-CoA racemase